MFLRNKGGSIMGPMRTLTVTIDWVLLSLLAIAVVFLIYALIKKNKKMIKYAGIATALIFVLLVRAIRFALTVKPEQ